MSRTSPRTVRITTNPERQEWNVEWHESLDSTMERAKSIARNPDSAGRVVVADFQTHGRGTRGRTWIAPPGSCLMFSFVLQPHLPVADLATLPTLIAGLVRDELNSRFAAHVNVDPPNDLVIHGRKLAGVLCQSHLRGTRVEWVVCGIGINTNLAASEVIVPDSTSLSIECGGRYDHGELLEHVLRALDEVRNL